ncbi:MAG: tetratricopeptide repeat protein [Phycisphaerales bacterium]|nr:MAG: tetratricopeptide repeat protein [Phycisphaerales bacterium]
MIPVIVPSYGKPEQLDRCIAHLRQQTVEVEIFVRDNNIDNIYFTAAINEGISRYLEKDCDYVLTLNQDMYLRPSAVEEMLKFMDSHRRCGIGMPLQLHSENPDYVVCAGCLDAFPFGKHQQGPLSEFTEDAPLFWGNGACMILRKQMIREIGLFDKNLIFIGSDSDYCFTARARGWQVWRIANARGIHEHGASGAVDDTGLDLLKINDMLYFGRKWLTGGLYRELAAEGENCTAEAVDMIMNQLAQAADDQKAASLKPQEVKGYNDEAIALARAGRHEEALEKCRQALSIMPEDPRTHHIMGFVLQMQGQSAEAIDSYERAVRLKPDFAEAYDHLGVALSEQGRCDEAIESHRKAIDLAPDYAGAYNNLAIALGSQNRFDEAISNYQQALRLEPDLVDAHYNLANVLREQGRYEEAIASYRRAIELRADHAEAYNSLGRALKDCGRIDEAVENCEKAIALNPDLAEAHNNLGLLLRALGRHEEAIAKFEEAIRLKTDYANAHWNYSLVLLSCGRFAEGWEEYRWRRKAELSAILDSQRERSGTWDGSPFEGKRLLIRYEQGMGDNLQFVRYVPMVKALGGTVIFEALGPLMGLLEGFEGIDELVEASRDGRPTVEFDLDVFILDLPKLFGTTVETIPAEVPYLFADRAKVDLWRDRLICDGLKVGIVWAGSPKHTNDLNRSCAPENFRPLAEIDGLRLLGLQKGPAAVQAAAKQTEMPFMNIGDELEDFADTAAVIENLDLVVSVDTAVLHLAGAMGKEVWGLLPLDADWRWLRERDDSPWYPTMKLFRQSRSGDWGGVFDRLAAELKRYVAARRMHVNG